MLKVTRHTGRVGTTRQGEDLAPCPPSLFSLTSHVGLVMSNLDISQLPKDQLPDHPCCSWGSSHHRPDLHSEPGTRGGQTNDTALASARIGSQETGSWLGVTLPSFRVRARFLICNMRGGLRGPCHSSCPWTSLRATQRVLPRAQHQPGPLL